MYPVFLQIHNLLRWFILMAGLLTLVFAYRGWFLNRSWTYLENILGTTFTSLIDVQLLVGLGLYLFLSPLTKTAFNDFGGAMKDESLRFYAVEHILMMVVALILIHFGRAKIKKALTPLSKHRIAALFYTIGFILILAAIPWSRALL